MIFMIDRWTFGSLDWPMDAGFGLLAFAPAAGAKP